MQTLSAAIYKREFVDSFPGDHSGDLTPRPTPGVLYSKAIPTAVKKPELLAWSEDLAETLGLQEPNSEKDIEILGGNFVAESMYPYAACYAGHQFGNWAGQLGDGRAITLGELEVLDKTWELQLKGAGPTPYSRRADGRAVLRSSVREYLMSEAMYYLGIPTTRALSLVSTGDPVLRDMFYNGNPAYEQGAIVMRVAPSFLRFGNFEMLAARNEMEQLRKLVDWTIERFYPELNGDDKIIHWFKAVADRTLSLIVEWQRVGFVHGVMNTDNMSILGLTIDYGPYSFLDDYDPNFTPNTTDLPGRRYAFGNQPSVGRWNLIRLANALVPLLVDKKPLEQIIDGYQDAYFLKYYTMMGEKLGLDELFQSDVDLVVDFEELLTALKPDMTIFFQCLMELPLEAMNVEQILKYFEGSFYHALSPEEMETLNDVIQAYIMRLKTNTCTRETSREKMRMSNPRFILRNYLLHEAIEELNNGDNSLFLKLQEAIKKPYSNAFDEFLKKRPDWAAKKAGCSMLSCSS